MDKQYILDLVKDWWAQGAAIGVAAAIWIAKAKKIFEGGSKILASIKFYFNFPFILDKKLNDQAALLDQRLNEQDKKLATIEKEVTPNGGGSIKDMISNINSLALIANLRTRRIISTNPTAIYECEPVDGKCITANSALCEMFGLSEAEMLGAGWLTAIVPDQRQKCWEGYQKSIESDIPYEWNYEVINHKTREKFFCRTEMFVLRDSKGKPILYQGIVEKISDLAKQ